MGSKKLNKTGLGRMRDFFGGSTRRGVRDIGRFQEREVLKGPILYGFDGIDTLPEGDVDVVAGGCLDDMFLCRQLNRLGYGRKLCVYGPVYMLTDRMVRGVRPARVWMGRDKGMAWYVWLSGWNGETEVKWL